MLSLFIRRHAEQLERKRADFVFEIICFTAIIHDADVLRVLGIDPFTGFDKALRIIKVVRDMAGPGITAGSRNDSEAFFGKSKSSVWRSKHKVRRKTEFGTKTERQTVHAADDPEWHLTHPVNNCALPRDMREYRFPTPLCAFLLIGSS